MDDIILEYKRVVGSQTSGRVFYREGDVELGVEPFENLTFAQMMVRFAEVVVRWPDAGAVIQRTDREGLQPFRLDKETTQLLRVDPVMVIRNMSSHDNVVVNLRKRPSSLSSSPLIVGYEAIAATFGDEVYARMRVDVLECPGCGLWAPIVQDTSQCRSKACGLVLPVIQRGDRWGGVQVSALLATTCDRFFLPRGWNTTAPWVTREHLMALYEKWIETKEKIV